MIKMSVCIDNKWTDVGQIWRKRLLHSIYWHLSKLNVLIYLPNPFRCSRSSPADCRVSAYCPPSRHYFRSLHFRWQCDRTASESRSRRSPAWGDACPWCSSGPLHYCDPSWRRQLPRLPWRTCRWKCSWGCPWPRRLSCRSQRIQSILRQDLHPDNRCTCSPGWTHSTAWGRRCRCPPDSRHCRCSLADSDSASDCWRCSSSCRSCSGLGGLACPRPPMRQRGVAVAVGRWLNLSISWAHMCHSCPTSSGALSKVADRSAGRQLESEKKANTCYCLIRLLALF